MENMNAQHVWPQVSVLDSEYIWLLTGETSHYALPFVCIQEYLLLKIIHWRIIDAESF